MPSLYGVGRLGYGDCHEPAPKSPYLYVKIMSLNKVIGTHQKTKMQDTICLVCTLSDEYTKSPQSTTAPAMAPKAAIVHPVLYW